MAIFDIFKKKKKEEPEKKEVLKKKKRPVKKEAKKAPKVKAEAKPKEVKKPVKAKPVSRPKKISEATSAALKEPHVTEKATDLTQKNQYIFKVWPRTGKTEIKKAIEDLYGIDVVSVKIINVRPKKRRLGRTEGERKGYKKAIVKVKEGQKIEILPR